ncbi:pilus assembly FimT family protein [Butyrivibrio sp. MC2013]|uniref:pilus assembly FimT family protein n=1 Tax=Butyrivibrio sp. MC2013 TaxID=1280686 RepID=UPI000409BE71|nr:type II secretion system protein [Butyrivibrio sp. MC2013]
MSRLKKTKKYPSWDNKGYTLIELIVILAIIGILTTGVVGIFNILAGRQAREIAEDLLSSLGKVRVITMSQSTGAADTAAEADVYLEVELTGGFCNISQVRKKDDGTIYVVDSIRIKSDGLTSFMTFSDTGITALVGDGVTGAEHMGSDGYTLILAYDRSTGGFIPQDDAEHYIKKIRIAQGNRAYELILTPATGKVELKGA